MTDLSALEKISLERDAYRYWMGLMLIHAGSGFKVSRELIESHLRDLKNGLPIKFLKPDDVLDEASWDEENYKRFAIYEAVAFEIIERLVAYEHSQDIRDLGFA